jgi:hypothetical protein
MAALFITSHDVRLQSLGCGQVETYCVQTVAPTMSYVHRGSPIGRGSPSDLHHTESRAELAYPSCKVQTLPVAESVRSTLTAMPLPYLQTRQVQAHSNAVSSVSDPIKSKCWVAITYMCGLRRHSRVGSRNLWDPRERCSQAADQSGPHSMIARTSLRGHRPPKILDDSARPRGVK